MDKSKVECLLNATEVADILHMSKASAYALLKSNALPTVRINSMVRVRRGDLERYIRDKTGLGTFNTTPLKPGDKKVRDL